MTDWPYWDGRQGGDEADIDFDSSLADLAELVVDDDPLVVYRDGVPTMVVMDWHQYDLAQDVLKAWGAGL